MVMQLSGLINKLDRKLTNKVIRRFFETKILKITDKNIIKDNIN